MKKIAGVGSVTVVIYEYYMYCTFPISKFEFVTASGIDRGGGGGGSPTRNNTGAQVSTLRIERGVYL